MRRLIAVAAALASLAVLAGGAQPAARANEEKIKIAFSEDHGLQPMRGLIVNPDGSHLRPLFEKNGYDDLAWSSDGTKVAYTVQSQGVFVMDSDGRNAKQIVSGPGLYSDAAWSADDQRIAFAKGTLPYGDKQDIWIVNADGSGARALTHDSLASSPAWSPDGERIAFADWYGGTPFDRKQLFIVDVDTGDRTQLTTATSGTNMHDQPSWSPDGGTIAFTWCCGPPTTSATNEIFVVSAAGGTPTQLTGKTADSHDDAWPDWSPDGTTIAFASARSGDWEIWAMDADGDNQKRLTSLHTRSVAPAWIAPPGKCAVGDCRVVGLEVTQGIQNLHNDVDLYERRPTFVRVHVRSQSGANIPRVTLRLALERGGNEIARLRPLNGPITVRTSPRFGRKQDSFLFRVPDAQTHGALKLKVVPAAAGDALECDEDARTGDAADCAVDVSFRPAARLKVRFFEIVWRHNGKTYDVPVSQFVKVIKRMTALYPVSSIDYDVDGRVLALDDKRSAIDSWLDVLSLNRKLDKMYDKDFPNRRSDHGKPIYVGIWTGPLQASIDGIAFFDDGPVAHVGTAVDSLNGPAHEVAHSLGRLHAPCGLDAFSTHVYLTVRNFFRRDKGYPYAKALIGTGSRRQHAYYGFDIYTHKVYDGPQTHDYMSYCLPQWTSAYTYNGLYGALQARFGTR